MYVHFNPNPEGKAADDCVVRGLTKLLGREWDDVFVALAAHAFAVKDMPSSNAVWGDYLKRHGYRRRVLKDTCPDCYTVRMFCEDNPKGKFLACTGTHVVAVVDGDYCDAWDSGNETVIYYFEEG